MPSSAGVRAAGPSSPDDLRTVTDLMAVPGVQEVRLFPEGVIVEFPEADFVIKMSNPRADAACETEWEVTVREATPGLSTWWGRWHRSFSVHRSAVGPLVADEVRAAMSRVHGMLEDHARASEA